MGLFITIEGSDFTGKSSTVIPGLQKALNNVHLPVLVSREPGGTKKGEAIRKQIFNQRAKGASALELAMLFNQARAIHLQEKIFPYLGKKKEKKTIVILDRYLDSTRVYQGYEGGLEMEKIFDLEKKYIDNYLPDLTLLLYLPEDKFYTVMTERIRDARDHNSWDQDKLSYQLDRQRLYLKLPVLAKSRGEARVFRLIDASKSKDAVVKKCINACRPYIKKKFDVVI